MDWYRIRHTLGMFLTSTAVKRAAYLKKHEILYRMGDNCMVMFRKIPLYPKLISFGNNVWVASGVRFITHDVIHKMLNGRKGGKRFSERLGCIDIRDNVFIGTDAILMPDVTVGPDVIVGAGSLVNKSISNGVYAGVPARYICSLDEYMQKRKAAPKVKVVREKGGSLSEQTVRECWERFERREKE